jgi:hypothetical protein
LWSVVSVTPPVLATLSPGITFADATQFNTVVSGLSGTVVLQWTNFFVDCPTLTAQVTLTTQVTASNAGAGFGTCLAGATLAAVDPTPLQGVWSVTEGGATVTSLTENNSTVTGLTAGTNTFIWSVPNAPCSTSSKISITQGAAVSTAAVTPSAPSKGSACLNSVTLSGNTPAVGTGLWTFTSGPTTATIATPSNPASSTTGLTTVGDYVFTWTISGVGCTPPSTSAELTLTRANAFAPSAGPAQTVNGANATLSASALPAGATGAWSVVNGAGQFANAASPTTLVTGLNAGVNTLQWTVTYAAPCAAFPQSATVAITSLVTAIASILATNSFVIPFPCVIFFFSFLLFFCVLVRLSFSLVWQQSSLHV